MPLSGGLDLRFKVNMANQRAALVYQQRQLSNTAAGQVKVLARINATPGSPLCGIRVYEV